jgi:hypothetical protein
VIGYAAAAIVGNEGQTCPIRHLHERTFRGRYPRRGREMRGYHIALFSQVDVTLDD